MSRRQSHGARRKQQLDVLRRRRERLRQRIETYSREGNPSWAKAEAGALDYVFRIFEAIEDEPGLIEDLEEAAGLRDPMPRMGRERGLS